MNYYNNVSSQQFMMGRCRGITHRIRRGDTLYKLSKVYGVSVSDIMGANPDSNIYNLQVGESICIPLMGGMEAELPTPELMPPPPELPTPELVPPENAAPEFLYEVAPGDTLNSILEKFNITFEEFALLNPQLMPIALEEGIGVFVPREENSR